jgi:hypothetical protein
MTFIDFSGWISIFSAGYSPSDLKTYDAPSLLSLRGDRWYAWDIIDFTQNINKYSYSVQQAIRSSACKGYERK